MASPEPNELSRHPVKRFGAGYGELNLFFTSAQQSAPTPPTLGVGQEARRATWSAELGTTERTTSGERAPFITEGEGHEEEEEEAGHCSSSSSAVKIEQ